MTNCDQPGLMPVEQAINKMLAQLSSVQETEYVSLLALPGRTLAKNIVSPINVPPADNSAMDGYAIRAEDLRSSQTLELVGVSMAGAPFNGLVGAGQCIRVMTGAVIPSGANAVVMQEQTQAAKNEITFNKVVEKGNNIRKAGEDIACEAVVIKKHNKLSPSHLSLLASIGVSSAEVFRKIKVAVIATGDELTSPGNPLKPGAIYESNRYALIAMLNNLHVDVLDMGIVTDSKDALRTAFDTAQREADLILTSGGVSVGDADFVKDILSEKGQVGFWKVAIKPGKPFAFGKLGKAVFCGLPGNPVSSYVTFQQLVIPVLHKMSGLHSDDPMILKAITSERLKKRPGRADYQRGIYTILENGQIMVKANGKQGSGIMSSIVNANCYIVLGIDCDDIPEGTEVDIQPFNALFSY